MTTSDGMDTEFSLVRGGPAFRLGRAFRVATGQTPVDVMTGVALALVAWVPLLVLALAQGVAFGDRVRIPLLYDLMTYARFLVAIPLLVGAESMIDRRLTWAVRAFVSEGIVPEARRADLDRALEATRRWRDAWLPELLLMVAAFAFAWTGRGGHPFTDVTTWKELGWPPQATWAGLWLTFVSLPLFGFLMVRWLWRLLLWSLLLWRISRLDLDLVPTHPDRAGGIAFVGIAHGSFNLLVAAMAVTFSARAAQSMAYLGESPERFQAPLAAFVVLSWILYQGPMLVFMPHLVAARLRGLREFDQLAMHYTRRFERKWIGAGAPADDLLGSPDIQSLADLGGGYDVVRAMRPVPFTLRQAIGLALSATLPMVPALATAIPLRTILTKLLEILGR